MKKIKALGEIALRVNDIPGMTAFYEDVVGLEVMRREENMTFFRIADGYAGHTQILAFFDRSSNEDYTGIDSTKTTIDHFAFTIKLEDLNSEKARLESLGIAVDTAVHLWVKWRSLFFSDPEGNRIEFVCYDESIES